MSEHPLISIVVPTLNQARFIEQTLASITGQNWPRTELIVIDGGSTDGTREIVQRFPVAHFVSEPDRGQADAINKGMRLAKGDILAWLNSDDYYLPLAFSRVVAALGDLSKPRLVYGGFHPTPPTDPAFAAAREAEVCLGLGAHTHYLERDQTTVAWMIDYLVRARPPTDDAAAPGAARDVPTVMAAAGQPAAVMPAQASVVSDGSAAPAAAPDATAPPPAPPAP